MGWEALGGVANGEELLSFAEGVGQCLSAGVERLGYKGVVAIPRSYSLSVLAAACTDQ